MAFLKEIKHTYDERVKSQYIIIIKLFISWLDAAIMEVHDHCRVLHFSLIRREQAGFFSSPPTP